MNQEEMTLKLTEVEQRSKSNTHRLDDVEKRQDNLDELVTSVAIMAKEQEHLRTDVTEIKTDVKALTTKPAKRWDAIVDKLIWAVLAAVVAFLLARVGL